MKGYSACELRIGYNLDDTYGFFSGHVIFCQLMPAELSVLIG
jgi:hypothetical protein